MSFLSYVKLGEFYRIEMPGEEQMNNWPRLSHNLVCSMSIGCLWLLLSRGERKTLLFSKCSYWRASAYVGGLNLLTSEDIYHIPRYCGTCAKEATRERTRQRVQQLRKRKQEQATEGLTATAKSDA